MKKIIVFLIVICILMTMIVYAEDNADSGSGNTNSALAGKGFYKSSEYMYKVSVYVGLSDKTDMKDNISEFRMIGDNAIYIMPNSFAIPQNTISSLANKIEYKKGQPLTNNILNSDYITGNIPRVPITNNGNINTVKSYFGDTKTLIGLIDAFATQKRTTRQALVSNIKFTINGVTDYYPPEKILPKKVNGQYQNRVAWLVIYEPVIIAYLKPDNNGNRQVLAFTATEYALAQKKGYFNFGYGTNGQYIKRMTHANLPNSIVLEYSWLGYPVTPPLGSNVHWDNDRIINGGGWGMRMLKANGANTEENDTQYDFEYRVDTEVITSVKVFAEEDITPDTRHVTTDTRDNRYKNPLDGKAYVTITANDQSTTMPLVMPSGNSQYAWLKWRTPKNPCEVEVKVAITGNSSAVLESGSRSEMFKVKIVDLKENEPPDPRPTDKNKSFVIPELPSQAEKKTAEWGVYSAKWVANFVWHEHWVRYHSGCHSKASGGTCHHYKWRDDGWWLDEGKWDYTYTPYFATLIAQMDLTPDSYNPTASGKTMKSGYGVEIEVDASLNTNAPYDHVTLPQNAMAYFLEFQYDTYWRLLDNISLGRFVFKANKHSTFNSPTHFTPLWYPDAKYTTYVEIIDTWTPDGMLRINMNDYVNIRGNLYQDWHVAPDKY